VIDPALLTRLAAILPGEWTAIRDGYALATGADTLTVRTPAAQYLVRLDGGDTAKTYEPADLAPLIRRVLGEAAFASLADPTSAAKVARDRKRSELNHRHQAAKAALHQAQDTLATVEAEIAAFDRETP